MTKLALIQMSMTSKLEENLQKSFAFIRQAAKNGAQIILLPELFENLYFCQEKNEAFFSLAHEFENHLFLSKFQALAKELNVVLPVSFFEKANDSSRKAAVSSRGSTAGSSSSSSRKAAVSSRGLTAGSSSSSSRGSTAGSSPLYYNSIAMINNDGKCLGIYRKTHIPSGPLYEEDFYFQPGNTGYKVWETGFGKIGVGICWDQWFPECARAMTLLGANLLLYPTAIGSEPPGVDIDTRAMWQKVMIGHAVANSIYIGAANRVGQEKNIQFYGSSFVSNFMGEKIAELGSSNEDILYADCDLDKAREFRKWMNCMAFND